MQMRRPAARRARRLAARPAAAATAEAAACSACPARSQRRRRRAAACRPEEREKFEKDLEARRKEAEAKRRTVEYRVYYADYQTVGGVLLPHRIQRSIDGKPTEEMIFDDVQGQPEDRRRRSSRSRNRGGRRGARQANARIGVVSRWPGCWPPRSARGHRRGPGTRGGRLIVAVADQTGARHPAGLGHRHPPGRRGAGAAALASSTERRRASPSSTTCRTAATRSRWSSRGSQTVDPAGRPRARRRHAAPHHAPDPEARRVGHRRAAIASRRRSIRAAARSARCSRASRSTALPDDPDEMEEVLKAMAPPGVDRSAWTASPAAGCRRSRRSARSACRAWTCSPRRTTAA